MAPLKLIVDHYDRWDDFEYIKEERNSNEPSRLYIKGPFMMAGDVNRNRRIYDINEMDAEVNRYITEMVNPGRALGELNHPSTPEVNLERACHKVILLEKQVEGKTTVYYGKSLVLNTPVGKVVQSLLNDNVKLGVSSRSLGKLIPEGYGDDVHRVQNLRIVAVDCVADPSFPKAFVNGILESKQWVLSENGEFEPYYDKFEKSINRLPKKDVEKYLTERIREFIQKIK